MLNASITKHIKHVQYPPNQQNWATDSVCCTVKECDRSRVQRLSPENWALLCTLNKNNIPIHLARQPLSLSLSHSLSPLLSYTPLHPPPSSLPGPSLSNIYPHTFHHSSSLSLSALYFSPPLPRSLSLSLSPPSLSLCALFFSPSLPSFLSLSLSPSLSVLYLSPSLSLSLSLSLSHPS